MVIVLTEPVMADVLFRYNDSKLSWEDSKGQNEKKSSSTTVNGLTQDSTGHSRREEDVRIDVFPVNLPKRGLTLKYTESSNGKTHFLRGVTNVTFPASGRHSSSLPFIVDPIHVHWLNGRWQLVSVKRYDFYK